MKLYLNEIGEYVMEDMVGGVAVAKMTRIVESRVTESHRQFRLNVDGLCIEGHTRLDPHGRMAYEWDCVGTSLAGTADVVETIEPIVGNWKPGCPRQQPRQRATPVPKKRWWMFWVTV